MSWRRGQSHTERYVTFPAELQPSLSFYCHSVTKVFLFVKTNYTVALKRNPVDSDKAPNFSILKPQDGSMGQLYVLILSILREAEGSQNYYSKKNFNSLIASRDPVDYFLNQISFGEQDQLGQKERLSIQINELNRTLSRLLLSQKLHFFISPVIHICLSRHNAKSI